MFSKLELRAASRRARVEERLAARLAAKRLALTLFESAGFGAATCGAMEIRNDAEGRPFLVFLDANLRSFARRNFSGVFLTLSHTRAAGYAALFARTLR
jgi:phosphopantetheinyl transferase (holo-ACP synthase)